MKGIMISSVPAASSTMPTGSRSVDPVPASAAATVLPVPGGVRQVAVRGPDAEQDERDVDEEEARQPQSSPEPADEPAAEHRPHRHRDPDDGTEESEGPAAGLPL